MEHNMFGINTVFSVKILLFTCSFLIKDSIAYAPSSLVRRFIHGCPFAFPCPPPPCDNPVYGPHDCCGSCPEVTISVPTASALPLLEPGLRSAEEEPLFSKHVPVISNVRASRRTNGKSNTFRKSILIQRRQQFTKTTYPTTTTTNCPFPCTHHGYHYCYPLPCYINCVDAVKGPGACCYECLNGPNCSHEGNVIPEGQNVTLPSGDVAFCSRGDLRGGSVIIYNSVLG